MGNIIIGWDGCPLTGFNFRFIYAGEKSNLQIKREFTKQKNKIYYDRKKQSRKTENTQQAGERSR